MKKTILFTLLFLLVLSPFTFAADEHDSVTSAVDILKANNNLLKTPVGQDNKVDIAVSLVKLNKKALANKLSVDDVRREINDIYEKYNAEPPYPELGSSGGFSLNRTTMLVILAVIVAGLAIYGIVKAKRKGKLQVISQIKEINIQNIVNKFRKHFSKYKKFYSVSELDSMLADINNEIKENKTIAEALKTRADKGEFYELKSGEAEAQKKAIEEHAKKLKGWLQKVDELLRTSVKIESETVHDFESIKPELLREEEQLNRHNPNYFSDEINEKIRKAKSKNEAERQIVEKDLDVLLYLIKTSNVLNFSTEEFKRTGMSAMRSYIVEEISDLTKLKRELRKRKIDGGAVKMLIGNIHTKANDMERAFYHGAPVFKKIHQLEGQLKTDIENLNIIDMQKVKFKRDVKDEKIRSAIVNLITAKEKGDQKEFLRIMRVMFAAFKGKRDVRIKLKEVMIKNQINEKQADEWIDEYIKSVELQA